MTSENYKQVVSHYQSLLSEHYTWTQGNDYKQKCIENHTKLEPYAKHAGLAIDLGCGSGFQSIPLLKMGLEVYSIDGCLGLLNEFKQEVSNQNLRLDQVHLIEGDILLFSDLVVPQVNLIVCMGDTLTHLSNLSEVKALIQQAFLKLESGIIN